MKLFQKGVLLIAIPIIAQFIFVLVLLVEYRNSEELIWRDVAFKERTSELVGVSVLCYKAIGLLSAYGMSKDPLLLAGFDGVYEQLVRKCEFLELLERSDPSNQDASIAREGLRKTVRDLYEFKRSMALDQKQYRINVLLVSETKSDIDAALTGLEKLIANRAKSGLPNSTQMERSRWLFLSAVIGGFSFNMLMSSILLALYAKDFAGRFRVIMDNTEKIGKGEVLNPEISGKDELKDLDRTMHEMTRLLKEAQDRKDELVSMVSHDLRGPLTSIGLSLQLIQMGQTGEVPPRIKERIDVADRTIKRLNALVRDILDLDKLKAGKMQLRLATTGADEVVNDCITELQSLAAESSVQLQNNLGKESTVVADSERLAQVFINLMTNAIKYSPPGSIVEITSKEENSFIRFQIRDRGPGIPPEYLDIIFMQFEQVPDDKRPKKGTTGLGLPICKLIVELHGGQIGVESKPGLGSTFWFTLPKAEIETL